MYWPYRRSPGPPLGESLVLNRDSPQARDLVAWYPPLGTPVAALAEQAHGIGALASSGTVTRETDPTTGGALNLDGTTGYLTLPNFGALFTNAITWTCWIKLRNQPAVSHAKSGIASFHTTSEGFNAHYAYTDGNTYLNLFRSNRLSASTGSFDVTQWHILAVTHQPTSAAGDYLVYRNNQVLISGTADASLPTWSASPRLGGSADGSLFLDGFIGEQRFYNRVLSATEIWQLYDPATRWDLYAAPRRFWPGVAASGSVTGTMALAPDVMVLAATGTFTPSPNVTGTMDLVPGAMTLAATGTFTAPPNVTGTMSLAPAAFTLAATGTFTAPPNVTGTMDLAPAAFTMAATGTFTAAGSATGTMTLTPGVMTLTATGTFVAPPGVTGTMTLAPSLFTMVATGTFREEGFVEVDPRAVPYQLVEVADPGTVAMTEVADPGAVVLVDIAQQ